MNKQNNIIIDGPKDLPIAIDFEFEANGTEKKVIIFAHGFKGFKDWGHWSLLGSYFAKAGFVFIKFNFSHNGTTLIDPKSFGDLEAFGNNNYSIEQDDLDLVIDWVENTAIIPSSEINRKDITLIGHSRGGGGAIIKTGSDDRISRLVSLAAISNIQERWKAETIEQWKRDGVVYVMNGRTKQNMPLYLQLYEDTMRKAEHLNIEKQARNIKQAALIIHGTEDPAVNVRCAQDLHRWIPHSKLLFIEGANHVFGGSHPYESSELPEHSLTLAEAIIEFVNAENI